jgi:hypothetical protein
MAAAQERLARVLPPAEAGPAGHASPGPGQADNEGGREGAGTAGRASGGQKKGGHSKKGKKSKRR